MDGAQRQRKELNLAQVKEERAEGLVGKETASAPMKRWVNPASAVKKMHTRVRSDSWIAKQKYVYLANVVMTFWRTSDMYGKVWPPGCIWAKLDDNVIMKMLMIW